MKNLSLTVILLLSLSCSQKKNYRENNFENNLFAKIDSFYCDSGIKRLLIVRHQKLNKQDFIQIKVGYDYDLDSLTYCREKNHVFSVFYNDNYFKNKLKYNIVKKDSLLKNYDYLNNKYSGNILYHNLCDEIYEVNDESLILLNKNNPIIKRLFNYTSAFVPEPPPAK
ncbi:hypothetical protein [Chryseobacterium sp. KMC2]|uniref:hypothetical protein n=1 Tax=Chryseobacterium sp. KMC2 TaxID=2800705 RepID=UPI001924463D|nr:hypothetical protein [Chryseobacterium sp. KMC2]MBL3547244.1 hypothetical protein [Chryseobacterium sp. KMC2]